MINNLDKDELLKLLKDTFDDVKSNTDYDSKKLSDLNTTFNWLLTLTAVFFVYIYRLPVDTATRLSMCILFLSKLIFALMILVLIGHKILSVQYEDFKNAYIKSLNAHRIDLTYNFSKWQSRVAQTVPFSTLTFRSNFIDGLFIVHSDENIIRGQLIKLKEKVEILGTWIKRTYTIGMVLFFISFLIVSFFLFA